MPKPPLSLIPAVLLSLVGAIQLWGVFFHGLSRWKGGGFGMYSEPHPSKRTIVFEPEAGASTDEEIRHELDTLVLEFKTFPTLRRFAVLNERVKSAGHPGGSASVFGFGLNPATLELSRPLLRAYSDEGASLR